jgi:hypothetical protein
LDIKIDQKEGSSSSLSAMAEKNGGGQRPSDDIYDEESWEQVGTTKTSERERESRPVLFDQIDSAGFDLLV